MLKFLESFLYLTQPTWYEFSPVLFLKNNSVAMLCWTGGNSYQVGWIKKWGESKNFSIWLPKNWLYILILLWAASAATPTLTAGLSAGQSTLPALRGVAWGWWEELGKKQQNEDNEHCAGLWLSIPATSSTQWTPELETHRQHHLIVLLSCAPAAGWPGARYWWRDNWHTRVTGVY